MIHQIFHLYYVKKLFRTNLLNYKINSAKIYIKPIEDILKLMSHNLSSKKMNGEKSTYFDLEIGSSLKNHRMEVTDGFEFT